MNITFMCPSCETKLKPVDSMQFATAVVKRTCRKCGERWQVVVQPIIVREGISVHKGQFTFLGLTPRRPMVVLE